MREYDDDFDEDAYDREAQTDTLEELADQHTMIVGDLWLALYDAQLLAAEA